MAIINNFSVDYLEDEYSGSYAYRNVPKYFLERMEEAEFIAAQGQGGKERYEEWTRNITDYKPPEWPEEIQRRRMVQNKIKDVMELMKATLESGLSINNVA